MDKVTLTDGDRSKMTSIRQRLRPIKDNHSIREVVISVFLADSIDLDEFVKIQLPDVFKDNTKIDEVKSLNIPFNNEGIDVEQTDSFKPQTIGVRLSVEKNGNVVRLLQGINESNRVFISYHNLDYSRWSPFFSEYLNYIKVITSILTNVNVEAFSLHYIDEFEWLEDANIDTRAIFNVNSKYLPDEFFNVLSSSFQLVTEKLFENNKCYDRIEIKTDNANKAINISHNIVRVLSRKTLLINLIDSEEFTKILEWAHKQNKSFLKEVLHKDIVQLIDLK